MTYCGHVLVIEDDPDFAGVFCEILEKEWIRVDVAHSGSDGIVALEALGPKLDVIVLDQKLHGRGGPDSGLLLISRIKNFAAFAKVVVVSGCGTEGAARRALQLGADDYVVKSGAFFSIIRDKILSAVEAAKERRIVDLQHGSGSE